MKTNIVGEILANGGDLVSYGSKGIKEFFNRDIIVTPKKKTRKLKPSIIRIGDNVRIKYPEIIIRIGYPMSFDEAVKEVMELYHNEIVKFLDTTIYKQKSSFVEVYDYTKLKTYNKIVSALAYEHLKSKQFGGRERKIYSEYRPELLGITAEVKYVFIRKTGIYFAPSGGYDSWSGEYDNEPGGLDKEKTHKILELDYWYPNEVIPYNAKSNYIQIEACNVEKFHKVELEKIAFKKGRQLGRNTYIIK